MDPKLARALRGFGSPPLAVDLRFPSVPEIQPHVTAGMEAAIRASMPNDIPSDVDVVGPSLPGGPYIVDDEGLPMGLVFGGALGAIALVSFFVWKRRG